MEPRLWPGAGDGWGPLCIILLLDAAVISAAVPVTAVTAVELESNLREVFTITVEIS